ncbi:MAG: hypothetical protein M3P18_05390, partial [Actinomycetota bacterium]|nr:hypothetical protein [Actinomycetota bacterium]
MATSETDERSELDRLLSPVSPGGVVARGSAGPATWLRAEGWRVFAGPRVPPASGEELVRFKLTDGMELAAVWNSALMKLSLPFDPAEAYENLVSEAWRRGTASRGLTAGQLDAFYRVKRLIPRPIQLTARRLLIRRQGLPEFPRWPLEESVVELLRFYARCLLLVTGKEELPFRWFWPHGHRAALVLTHDVESAEGLRLAVEVANFEEERGFRSSFNVVADWYPIDHGILHELSSRSFEIGVHGIHHDRSMFATRQSFEAQLPAVRDAATRFGAVGF